MAEVQKSFSFLWHAFVQHLPDAECPRWCENCNSGWDCDDIIYVPEELNDTMASE